MSDGRFTERLTEMVPVRVDMTCECGGRMRPTGITLTSNPPQYPHRCNVCDTHKNFLACYPFIKYVEKE